MFIFPLEGGDMRQPQVHCVLHWLRSSFDVWSAGLCEFEARRWWPKEDPERETSVQSWGFLRLANEPTSLHVVSKCRQWTQLEDRNISPSTVVIAVEMPVTLCRATARWSLQQHPLFRRGTHGAGAPARGPDLRGKCAPPEPFGPTRWVQCA